MTPLQKSFGLKLSYCFNSHLCLLTICWKS